MRWANYPAPLRTGRSGGGCELPAADQRNSVILRDCVLRDVVKVTV